MSSKDDILRKLKKLIAHRDSAKDIGSIEEAETFSAKINELLLKHKLEMTEVELHNLDRDDPIGEEYAAPGNDLHMRKRNDWQCRLSQVVAAAHFCQVLYILRSNTMLFIGRESDRAIAIYLYIYLVRTLHTVSKSGYDRLYHRTRNAGGDVSECWGWRGSFLAGAITAIEKRLAETRQTVTQAATTTQTALIRVADAAVQKYVADNIPGVRSVRSSAKRSTLNMDGFIQGKQFGSNISLQQGITDTGHRPHQLGPV